MIVDCTLTSQYTDHGRAQDDTNAQLLRLGFRERRWISGMGLSTHTWRVKCKKEDLVILRLKCDRISTEYYEARCAEVVTYQEQIRRMNTLIEAIHKDIGIE